jgi:hypothetical protein
MLTVFRFLSNRHLTPAMQNAEYLCILYGLRVTLSDGQVFS